MRLGSLLFSLKSAQVKTYGKLSKSELLDQFSSKNWKELTNDNKLQLLNEAGKAYAEEYGIKNPPHIEEEYGSRYGGYNGSYNVIKINLDKCTNPYEALDTVVHEENHAYQEQCIREGKGYTAEERALFKAESGFAYRQDGEEYDRQSIEIDSNNAGAKFSLQEQERFQKDPAYATYMSGRVTYFEQTAKDYINNREACDESERKQIAEALSRREVDAEESKLAENCLQDGHNYIKMEAVRISEQSKEALKCSSIACSKDLHERFDVLDREGFPGKKYAEMKELQVSIQEAVDVLKSNKDVCSVQLAEKNNALAEYITDNNMSRYESLNDPVYQRMAQEINELKSQIHEYDYHIVEIETDSKLIGRANAKENVQGKQEIEEATRKGEIEEKSEETEETEISKDREAVEIPENGEAVEGENEKAREGEALQGKGESEEMEEAEEVRSEEDDGLGSNDGLTDSEIQDSYDDGLGEDGSLESFEAMRADGLEAESNYGADSGNSMDEGSSMDSGGSDGGMDAGNDME